LNININMFRLLLLSILLLLPFQDKVWELQKQKSGIEIFTRKVDGSSFREFKGTTIIQNVTLKKVLDVILDIEGYKSWFPDCMNSRVLEQVDKFHVIQYVQIRGPFPVRDRDSVFEQSTEIDEDGKHAVISLKAVPDYIAENEDMVRIRKGRGFWDLEVDNIVNVKVIYQFLSDPGGDIPAWLANSFVVTQPFETLDNLRKKLAISLVK
jgi:hypothetical protein